MRFLLPFLTAAVCLASCKKEKPVAEEIPEEKTATYHIFAARNYSDTQVENTTAALRLQLHVINYRTGEPQLIWDSILPVRRLVDFPLYSSKIEVVKKHLVLNSHQKLNASFSVVYRDGQLISQQGKSDEAVPGIRAILLEASL